jgi:hypothetical protein
VPRVSLGAQSREERADVRARHPRLDVVRRHTARNERAAERAPKGRSVALGEPASERSDRLALEPRAPRDAPPAVIAEPAEDGHAMLGWYVVGGCERAPEVPCQGQE